MKVCPKCQLEYPQETVFCKADGSRLVEKVDSTEIGTVPATDPMTEGYSLPAAADAHRSDSPNARPKGPSGALGSFSVVPALIALGVFCGFGLVGWKMLGGPRADPTPQPTVTAPPTAPVQQIIAPDLSRVKENQSRDLITSKSLQPDVTTGFSATVPAGLVISQAPPAGSSIGKGGTVRVRVSTGPSPEDQKRIVEQRAADDRRRIGLAAERLERERQRERTPVTVPIGPASLRTYEAPSFNYKIDCPSDWSRSETYKNRGGFTRTTWSSPEPDVSFLIDIMRRGPEGSPLSHFQGLDRRSRAGRVRSYQLLSLEPSQINGHDGVRWVFMMMPGRRQVMLKKIDRETYYNGNSYALLFTAPAERFAGLQMTFDQIFLSFQFTGG